MIQWAKRFFGFGGATQYTPVSGRLVPAPGFGAASLAGVTVTEQTALTIPAFLHGVRLYSQIIAQSPFNVTAILDRGTQILRDHPVHRLLNSEPNEFQTAHGFRETVTGHAVIWGNGYAFIERNGNYRPTALIPLLPDRTYPVREAGKPFHFVSMINGEQVELGPYSVLHLPGFGYDGLTGVPLVRLMRDTLGLAKAEELYASAIFGNGARPGGIVEVQGQLSDAARKNLKASMADNHAGLANAFRTLFLEEGMKFTPVSTAPNDAQMVEARSFQLGDLARVLGLSPHLLYDLSRATFSNIEHLGIEAVTNTLGMNDRDFGRYSVLRAISLRAKNKPLDGIEAEVNAELAKRSGKSAQGFYVPMEAAFRALDTSAGTGSVGTNVKSDMIELLRNNLVIAGLGTTILTDMVGKFALPRQSAGATAYWLAESGAPTASNQTVDQVSFTPKTVGAFTDISRQFVNQTSLDAEALVRNDLAAVLARAIDLAAIAGTGASNQPTGILTASGVGTVAGGTNGLAPTWANVVKLETTVLAANASPVGKYAYLSNSKVNGALKTIDKTSGGYGQFIMTGDGKVNGYNFATTNAVPSNLTKGSASGICSALIFGNWQDLVVSFWGGLDLTVDPYTGSSSGTVRIVALQDADIQLRHAASFAYTNDILA